MVTFTAWVKLYYYYYAMAGLGENFFRLYGIIILYYTASHEYNNKVGNFGEH